MSKAVTKSSWQPMIHRSAVRELSHAPKQVQHGIREVAVEAAQLQKPSSHPDIKLMRGSDGLQRIRVGQWRALVDRYPPQFRILLVDRRRKVYDRVEEAKERR